MGGVKTNGEEEGLLVFFTEKLHAASSLLIFFLLFVPAVGKDALVAQFFGFHVFVLGAREHGLITLPA